MCKAREHNLSSFYPSDTPQSSIPGINELIQSLQRIQTVLKSNGHRISEDMTLVAQLLTNPEFQKVLAVHNKVQETWCLNRPPTPVTDNAQELVAEVGRHWTSCWSWGLIVGPDSLA